MLGGWLMQLYHAFWKNFLYILRLADWQRKREWSARLTSLRLLSFFLPVLHLQELDWSDKRVYLEFISVLELKLRNHYA